MDGDHYFSPRPTAADERRTITVKLAGREVEVTTSTGVFSGHRVDLGTRVLLRDAPPPPVHGDLLDLGCGWGPIALTMALLSPEATVWAVDVNDRALELVRLNAEALGLGNIRATRPDDVPPSVRFAAMWSNPPIRVGKAALHEMLREWLLRLDDGATAHVVVQRNLGADSLARWLDAELGPELTTSRAGSAKGFRVLAVSRRSPAP
jgi:16S rRNA (guanine1207-N2)-methyltransferase